MQCFSHKPVVCEYYSTLGTQLKKSVINRLLLHLNDGQWVKENFVILI